MKTVPCFVISRVRFRFVCVNDVLARNRFLEYGTVCTGRYVRRGRRVYVWRRLIRVEFGYFLHAAPVGLNIFNTAVNNFKSVKCKE